MLDLVLRGLAGAPVREAQVTAAERYLADELPRGPLRDRLAPALGVRALLPLGRVRSRTRSLAVLNRDAKTVVRLELEDAEVVGNGGARLPPRLRVQPVLGYDKAYVVQKVLLFSLPLITFCQMHWPICPRNGYATLFVFNLVSRILP